MATEILRPPAPLRARIAIGTIMGLGIAGVVAAIGIYANAKAPEVPTRTRINTFVLQYQDLPSSPVFVLRDGRMSEFFRLTNAGVKDMDVLAPLIACEVAPKTKAVVIDGSLHTSKITVIEGPQAGCRGVIPNEWGKYEVTYQ